MSANDTRGMDESFFAEYTADAAILKYSKATAGYGISYLLEHDYKDVYLDALSHLPPGVKERGIRVLEFGCGAGMNLIHLIAMLTQSGYRVEKAFGADFSPALIDAARNESKQYLPQEERGKVGFFVAKNETLIADLATALSVRPEELEGSFDLVLGVNTMRYCHRTGREMECANDIMALLAPGGVCVNIDMNNGFPAFRSALKDLFRNRDKQETYLPTLEQYAAPFEKSGFQVLRKEHFCWIPHSAGKLMCAAMSALTPVLNAVARSHAMRSLIVAKKPAAS